MSAFSPSHGSPLPPAPTWRERLVVAVLRRGILLALAAYLAVELWLQRGPAHPRWMLVVAVGGILVWLVSILLPPRARRVEPVLSAVMLAVVFTAPATDLLGVIPPAVALVGVLRRPERPVWHGAAALAGCLAVLAGTGAAGAPAELALGAAAALVIAALVGVSRRQAAHAAAQGRELERERLAVREEQARAELLADRSRVAREIHDVLAHSLGGLVIQLDALEALLESGRADDALARVREARALAADGLGEARRAVAALRDPVSGAAGPHPGAVPGGELVRSLGDVVRVHERLGGGIRFEVAGAPRSSSAETATALTRALQEALANARKHAPGVEVRAALSFRPDAIALEVRTPFAPRGRVSDLAATGGGHGLSGMAERFRELPGASLEYGARTDAFVVRAEVAA